MMFKWLRGKKVEETREKRVSHNPWWGTFADKQANKKDKNYQWGIGYYKKEKRNKSSSAKGWFKELDALGWFFIGVLCLILCILLYLTVNVMGKSIDSYTPEGYEYYDEDLNYLLMIPNGWSFALPEKEVVEEAVYEATGGIPFDMRLHSLRKEIVPIALTKSPDNPDEDNPDARFLTLAFRGLDREMAIFQDEVKLMDDLKLLLKESEQDEVKVNSVERINGDMGMFGYLLEAEAVSEGRKVYYYQYLEPAGRNLMTITYGATRKSDDNIEDINYILENILFLDGGEFTVEGANPYLEKSMQEKREQESTQEVKSGQQENEEGEITEDVLEGGTQEQESNTGEVEESNSGWGEPETLTPSFNNNAIPKTPITPGW